jgi:signal transduction histidine kinase
MLGQLVAGLFFVGSVFVRDRTLRARALPLATGAGVAGLVAIGGLCLTWPGSPPDGKGNAGLHLFAAVIFVACAVRFTRRAGRDDDRFLYVLALSAVVAIAARANYILYPAAASAVGPGDVFRLLVHVVLLAGVALELSRYWRELAAASVADERRRIARDLHDGIAQELAHIARHATGGDREAIGDAARRALTDVRAALEVLRPAGGVPLAVLLPHAVCATAERNGAQATVVVGAEVVMPDRDCEEIVRIACEAVANAARHGGARRIRVTLEGHDSPRLEIADDGTGFDPTAAAGRGAGVVGMRERAARMGAELRIRSAPGAGAEVEIVLP